MIAELLCANGASVLKGLSKLMALEEAERRRTASARENKQRATTNQWRNRKATAHAAATTPYGDQPLSPSWRSRVSWRSPHAWVQLRQRFPSGIPRWSRTQSTAQAISASIPVVGVESGGNQV